MIALTHLKKYLYLIGIIFCLFFPSCQFGNKDEGLDALSQKKRSLDYYVTLALPSQSESESNLSDLGEMGLNFNWGDEAEIAVIGKEFEVQKDTSGVASIPFPIKLSYSKNGEITPSRIGVCSALSFDFTSYAKHSIGEDYATQVQFIYPYDRLIGEDGDLLSTDVDSIPFSFTGQNGLLDSLWDRYFVAVGKARAICKGSQVTMVDDASCNGLHDHQTKKDEMVVLDPKVAILRMSLAVPAQEDFTLTEFVRALNMDGNSYYIDRIQLENRAPGASGISKTFLKLQTGHMEAHRNALNTLSLVDNLRFMDHPDIKKDEGQFVSDSLGWTGTSWGTCLYLAMPCTDDGKLELDPVVTVTIKKIDGTNTETLMYYGALETTIMEEGRFYVTSPVMLYRNIDTEKAKSQIWLM